MQKTKVIILAAGKGKRMGHELPKVLLPVGGMPIITRLLDTVQQSGVTDQPIVVIGHGFEEVCAEIGTRASCVMQEKQLGTGHAVQVAKEAFRDVDQLVVLYGDHPFVSPQVIRELAALREKSGAKIAMMTTTVLDFEDWRAVFKGFAKIIRDAKGNLAGIREKKDCSPEEVEIREINPGFYCFDIPWLLAHIDKLTNQNAQGEFYITELMEIAFREGAKIATLPIPPEETVGVNSPEEFAIAEQLAKNNIETKKHRN